MDEHVQGVIDTVDAVTQHRIQLSELLEQLHEAKSQVSSSSVRARQKLDAHFSQLKLDLNAALDARRRDLEEEIEHVEVGALEPLVETENTIKEGIKAAKDVMEEGRQLLSGDHESLQEEMVAFKKHVDSLQLQQLPEVPPLPDVPCLHVDVPESPDKERLVKTVRKHGKVLSKAPVQIAEVQQRPGALMVKWTEVEEEHWLDLNEYRLQYCLGVLNESNTSQVMHEAYQGSGTCHVVRHLRPSASYTFRVCGRAEGAETWSPWSIPRTAVTDMPHYQWSPTTEDYAVSGDHGAACKTSPGTSAVHYSDSNSYICGHTIVFTVMDAGHEGDGNDGIALTAANSDKTSLMGKDTIFVSCQGGVYIDGQEKTTRLPPLSRGSVLTFDTVVLPSSDKVRVTIEVNERIVTFDWVPENTQSSTARSAVSLGLLGAQKEHEKDKNLFFAMKFRNKDWKIGVE